jgi:hypothetical protein
MYRRPKFLEVLLEIRQQMAHEADYDVDLFTEIARSGARPPRSKQQKDVTGPRQSANLDAIVWELTHRSDG